MKKSLLFLLLLLGFLKAQALNFQVVIIFKQGAGGATWADITAIKTALNAVQIDSTFPSRALLWNCSVPNGATITVPRIAALGGSTITSLAITAGGGGSEAIII